MENFSSDSSTASAIPESVSTFYRVISASLRIFPILSTITKQCYFRDSIIVEIPSRLHAERITWSLHIHCIRYYVRVRAHRPSSAIPLCGYSIRSHGSPNRSDSVRRTRPAPPLNRYYSWRRFYENRYVPGFLISMLLYIGICVPVAAV